MLLYLTAIDPQNDLHEFSCYFDRLELCFDVLNRIVAKGDKLISAQLSDEHGVINLPIEAFDGGSVLELIKELEGEWKFILDQPAVTTTEFRAALLTLMYQRLTVCEDRIVRTNPLLNRVDALLLRAHKMKASLNKYLLEKNYQGMLNTFHNQLDRDYLTRQRIQQSISRLC